MLFSKKRKPSSALAVALLASLAFMALAIWGWGVPLATVGQFLLISLVLMLGLMVAAIVLVACIKFLQRLSRRD